MAKPDIWMPLYIGDYLADTMHLTDAQHGHYLLAIMAYWKNGGPLPDNEEEIARCVRMDRAYAPEVRSHHFQVLRRFFRSEGGLLHHDRIERELFNARSKSESAKNAAKSRWSKSKNNADASLGHMRGACPSPSPSPPYIPPPKRDIPADISEVIAYGVQIALPEDQCRAWWDHFEANGWKVGGKTAMKNWKASVRTWWSNWRAGTFTRGNCNGNGNATGRNAPEIRRADRAAKECDESLKL